MIIEKFVLIGDWKWDESHFYLESSRQILHCLNTVINSGHGRIQHVSPDFQSKAPESAYWYNSGKKSRPVRSGWVELQL